MDATADRTLVAEIRAELAAAADPHRAGPMRRYMKSAMPCYGVGLPDVRRLTSQAVRHHPFADEAAWRATVLALWRDATHREERYAALALLRGARARRWLTLDALPLLEELIVTGAWWDLVDEAAKRVRDVLVATPDAAAPVLVAWAEGDLWLRRAAIICQVGRKDATDRRLLAACIEPSMGSREFFLRKAIGWALRDLSRHDPTWVLAFVREHREALSPLSKREALRVLVADGRVAPVA